MTLPKVTASDHSRLRPYPLHAAVLLKDIADCVGDVHGELDAYSTFNGPRVARALNEAAKDANESVALFKAQGTPESASASQWMQDRIIPRLNELVELHNQGGLAPNTSTRNANQGYDLVDEIGEKSRNLSEQIKSSGSTVLVGLVEAGS